MDVKNYLHEWESISAEDFIAQWETEEKDRNDPYSKDRIRGIESVKDSLKFYRAEGITEEGIKHLFLPHHNHKYKDYIIEHTEGFLSQLVCTYKNKYLAEHREHDCIQRLLKAHKEFDTYITNHDADTLPENYTLGRLCNDLVTNYRCDSQTKQIKNDKLYCANFHRFLAYGLWIDKNGYKPIPVYYFEWASPS